MNFMTLFRCHSGHFTAKYHLAQEGNIELENMRLCEIGTCQICNSIIANQNHQYLGSGNPCWLRRDRQTVALLGMLVRTNITSCSLVAIPYNYVTLPHATMAFPFAFVPRRTDHPWFRKFSAPAPVLSHGCRI
jgi:hypothetical protein